MDSSASPQNDDSCLDSSSESSQWWQSTLNQIEQEKILHFFQKNQCLILNDILKGRGQFASEWFSVILNIENKILKWTLKPINEVINFFSGEIQISKQGSLYIGKITMQRKGGDNGRNTANMLQFKLNPCELFRL